MKFPILKDGRYGFINSLGIEVEPCIYDYASKYNDGYASVRLGERFQIINEKNATLLDLECGFLISPMQEICVFTPTNQMTEGYINLAGNVIAEPRFYSAADFSEGIGVARQKIEGSKIQAFALDKDGRQVFGPLEMLASFSAGLAGFLDSRVRLFGFVNKQGATTIAPNFLDVGGFSDGLAKAQCKTTRLFGYINQLGEWEIAPKYEDCRVFSEGLAAVREPSWPGLGFIDTSGTLKIAPRFEDVTNYAEGRAFVTNVSENEANDDGSECWGVIDTTGQEITPFQFSGTDPLDFTFENGLASVGFQANPDKRAYIDRRGYVIWEHED